MQRPRETKVQNGTILEVFGEPIEIIASSTSTNNAFVIGMQTSPPGGGPPPHRHLNEDEVFTVIEGDYEFFDETKWVPFRRGEVRYSLRGSFHGFRNIGETAGKMMFMTNGAGLDEYFAEISRLQLPKDMDQLLEISKSFQYEYLTP